MLNKLLAFIREQNMVAPGDTVVVALSGGVDSSALLFAFYLLKEKLDIRLEAVHFNHHLRGEESLRDEMFARQLCHRYDIPLHMGAEAVVPGKKGLEAAAREARYAFFATLDGKIATAHTADDNAETILMHLIRGTGLKGLGGIAPVRGNLIRPMLTVTRKENEAFLEEWCVSHVEDSSNGSDLFLRNRVRHHVMPFLMEENPRFAENMTRMALRLRQDEDCLSAGRDGALPDVEELKAMHPALRFRALEGFLKESGVREPEDRHLKAVENLLYADSPSARVCLPGGITIARNYNRLEAPEKTRIPEAQELTCPGEVCFGDWIVLCAPVSAGENTMDTITVVPAGTMMVTSRRSGDSIRLPGGTKSLKKLCIDRKIPAAQRALLPVVRDDEGILGVGGIGGCLNRLTGGEQAVTIRFLKKEKKGE